MQEREEREEDQPSIYSLKTYFSVEATLWRPSFVRISCLGFVNLVEWQDSNFKCKYLPIWEPASLKSSCLSEYKLENQNLDILFVHKKFLVVVSSPSSSSSTNRLALILCQSRVGA